MSIATYSYHSIREIIQSYLDDTAATMLTANEIDRIIVQNLYKQQTWSFQKITDNLYTSDYEPMLYLYNMNGFVGEANLAYTLYSNAGSIIATSIPDTGTHTAVASSATVLTDSAGAFVTNGCDVGDVVTNSTTSNTATIVTVDSETQLTTTSITGSWNTSDVYSVATTVVHSTDTVTVNGCNCDFGKAFWEVIQKLKVKLAQRTPESIGDYTYDPAGAIDALEKMAGQLLGARRIG